MMKTKRIAHNCFQQNSVFLTSLSEYNISGNIECRKKEQEVYRFFFFKEDCVYFGNLQRDNPIHSKWGNFRFSISNFLLQVPYL